MANKQVLNIEPMIFGELRKGFEVLELKTSNIQDERNKARKDLKKAMENSAIAINSLKEDLIAEKKLVEEQKTTIDDLREQLQAYDEFIKERSSMLLTICDKL
jgi:CII-binding regulator of phage lambda lysogenization HflD